MQPTPQKNTAANLEHSKLGISAFAILLSPVIPFSTVFIFRWGILRLFLKPAQAFFLNQMFTYWYIFAPLLAFILSIIDAKRTSKQKTLTWITLIISSVIIAISIFAMIIITIDDIQQLF